MKRSMITMIAAVAVITGTLSAYGTTNYWDNNSDTAGFGNAGGTWGIDPNWSTNTLGSSIPVVTNTTATDELHFGSAFDGLGSGTVTVDSTNQSFQTMTFGSASGPITLAGGTLNLAAPNSIIKINNSSNTIASVLAGTNALQKSSAGAITYNAFLTTNAVTIFTNASLADYVSAGGVTDGAQIGVHAAAAYFFTNNGTTATCQMQTLDGGHTKCVKVELTQSGTDITGRAVYAKFLANQSNLGFNFDTGGSVGTVATSSSENGYGIAKTTLFTEKTFATFLRTTSITIFKDTSLSDFTGADGVMGGASIHNSPVEADAYYFANNGSTATFQLQTVDNPYTKCVKIELTQSGADISGRVVYAKYTGGSHLGYNFDVGGSNFSIATSYTSDGYGAAQISLISTGDNSLLTLTGVNTYTGDTAIGSGILEIGPGGQLGSGTYAGAISNSGQLLYNSSSNQLLSGSISGSGSLVKDSPAKVATNMEYTSFLPATPTLATVFPNTSLADVTGASGILGGISITDGAADGTAFFFTNNGAIATWQLQTVANSPWTKCVKVELTQVGTDIKGRVLYAKYTNNGSVLGYDFDTGGNAGSIATSTTSTDYGARETTITINLHPKLTLSGVNSYSGGTTVNKGILEAIALDALPTSGGITVNSEAELLLNVPGDPGVSGSVGGNNPITVNGGTLTLNGKFNAGYSRPITINGGIINSTITANSDNSNYMNNLTLMNGAQVIGYKIRMGYLSAATITVSGSSASSLAAGIDMANHLSYPLTFNVADATGDAAADLTIPGVIKDYNASLDNMPIIKSGAGTLALSGANTHVGMITIDEGTLALGADSTLNSGNSIVLSGGALDMGAFTNTVGTLSVDADSTLVLGAGEIAFADSSATTWSGTLSVTNTLDVQTVRFGTDDSALTSAQLAAIDINGESARLTADGYLTTMPAGTLIIIK